MQDNVKKAGAGRKKQPMIASVTNGASDLLDKVSSPSERAGSVCERAAKMRDAGVSFGVIAMTLNEGSANNKKYTPEKAEGLCDAYDDCRTRVNITKRQAKALIDDAVKYRSPAESGGLITA